VVDLADLLDDSEGMHVQCSEGSCEADSGGGGVVGDVEALSDWWCVDASGSGSAEDLSCGEVAGAFGAEGEAYGDVDADESALCGSVEDFGEIDGGEDFEQAELLWAVGGRCSRFWIPHQVRDDVGECDGSDPAGPAGIDACELEWFVLACHLTDSSVSSVSLRRKSGGAFRRMPSAWRRFRGVCR